MERLSSVTSTGRSVLSHWGFARAHSKLLHRKLSIGGGARSGAAQSSAGGLSILAFVGVLPSLSKKRERGRRKLGRCSGGGLSTTWVSGIRDIADQYDAFILDLWGVVHNGAVAFPWAKETLMELKRLRKLVLFLSNSSRRRETNSAALEKLGVGPDLYVDLITSGEVSWRILAGACDVMDHITTIKEAKNILTFGNGSDDVEYMRALKEKNVAADAAEADLLLARGCFSLYGPEVKQASWEDFDAQLRLAAAGRVPMLVANPDVVRPDGNDSPMPGRLAQRYRELGGPDPTFVGKPYAEVFQLALEQLQEAGVPATARVCMVGDSVRHDVRGACAAGLDVVLLCSGVHSEALGLEQAPAPPRRPSEESLRGFLGALPPEETPTYVTAALAWGEVEDGRVSEESEVAVCGLACVVCAPRLSESLLKGSGCLSHYS
ncbi:unnamed protein product [Durusdinium trenchii]|uniref:Uncharacterized protein n=1 Tax=Durusdinium trenchii TaxID=1381693 RepID=A0ABP0LW42_9DINO